MWDYLVFRGTQVIYTHHSVPASRDHQEGDWCMQRRTKIPEQRHWYLHRGKDGWRSTDEHVLPKDLKLLLLVMS